MSRRSQPSKLRSRIAATLAPVALIASVTACRDRLATQQKSEQPEAASSTDVPAAQGGEIDHYTCSMHPSVHQSGPGKCPICGMELIPVTKAQVAAGVVTVPAPRQQLIGVRTSEAREAPMLHSLRAIGRLTYDESRLSEVSLKVRGWIVKLFVTNTGERVKRGQTLFTLYSPELYAAQQDFLLAQRTKPALPSQPNALARSARERLRLLDLTEAQIDEIARRGEPIENIAFKARESGFVIEKNVLEGAAVEPGMRLYRIASLDKVWIEADVYESDFASVRVGQTASVTLDYVPGSMYEARVAYVYPYLNAETRTGRVRLELTNRELELRPGMYANVQLKVDLGTRLQVPASAIIFTGPRRLVFVDLGEGRFRPQEVQIGARADDMVEVVSGLKAGDRVASSGVFLIAAEARISSAAQYWETTQPDETAPVTAAREVAARAAKDSHPEAAADESPTKAKRSHAAKTHPTHAPTGHAKQLEAAAAAPEASAVEETYVCPMHPEVQSSTPGTCPKCGMKLERRATPEVP